MMLSPLSSGGAGPSIVQASTAKELALHWWMHEAFICGVRETRVSPLPNPTQPGCPGDAGVESVSGRPHASPHSREGVASLGSMHPGCPKKETGLSQNTWSSPDLLMERVKRASCISSLSTDVCSPPAHPLPETRDKKRRRSPSGVSQTLLHLAGCLVDQGAAMDKWTAQGQEERVECSSPPTPLFAAPATERRGFGQERGRKRDKRFT